MRVLSFSVCCVDISLSKSTPRQAKFFREHFLTKKDIACSLRQVSAKQSKALGLDDVPVESNGTYSHEYLPRSREPL